MNSGTTDIDSLLQKAQSGHQAEPSTTESFTSSENSNVEVKDVENEVVQNKSDESINTKNNDISIKGKTLNGAKELFLKAYKARPKTTILGIGFSILMVFIAVTDEPKASKVNGKNEPAETTATTDNLIVTEAEFGQFIEPEISLEDAFTGINSQDNKATLSDQETSSDSIGSDGLTAELKGLVEMTKPDDKTDEVQDILIKDLESKLLDVQSLAQINIERFNEYSKFSTSEIEKLRQSVRNLNNEITNIKDDVNSKKYDLGYEKDRPQITLKATVPEPDQCSKCVSHASFMHNEIKYQVGNNSSWHGFKIEILGNRMSLIKNDYVYDYWVGQ
jgi:hypothetical protein